jgi:uncharacterized FlaG/YvyC family protein
VIYQVLDVGSGEVERQTPEEAILRLRAYMNAPSHRDAAAGDAPHADVEA